MPIGVLVGGSNVERMVGQRCLDHLLGGGQTGALRKSSGGELEPLKAMVLRGPLQLSYRGGPVNGISWLRVKITKKLIAGKQEEILLGNGELPQA